MTRPKHRGQAVGLFVGRRRYLELLHRHQSLMAEYRALENDHQGVLEDHEELLYGRETGSAPPARHVPSWAETEPIPVITEVPAPGLDPDKATALVHRGGFLTDPAGEWGTRHPGTPG